jgi:quercetin dioxygenase-like cupin family protein
MSDETEIKGKTFKAADMVSIQAGAVVSRTLIQKKTATLTLFAFDAGQALSEHTAPFDATVLVLDGEADVTISGHVHPVKKDDLLIMPANEPHGLKARTPFKMMLVMIRE